MSRLEQFSVGELTSTEQSIVTYGVGAKEGSTAQKRTMKITERGTDVVHKTTFTFSDMPFTIPDTGANLGIKIYTFPAGRITFIGGYSSLAITTTTTLASTLNAAAVVQTGVGTVTGTGALSTTEQDLINEHDLTASATIDVAGATVEHFGIGQLAPHDGTSTAIAAFLNFDVTTDTEIDGDAGVTIAGTVNLYWSNLT